MPIATSTHNDEHFDVVVVGAGVVGSALAYALGSDGRKVLLLERDLSEPNRIVGELLQPGGVEKLTQLGLRGCLDGIDAIQVHGYGVFIPGKKQDATVPQVKGVDPESEMTGVKLSYPRNSNNEFKMGYSFHHGRFIMQLRKAAMSLPNVTVRQGTVCGLVEESDRVVGVSYRAAAPKQTESAYPWLDPSQHSEGEKSTYEARASLTIVCDGSASNLRSKFHQDKPVATSSFVGVIVKDCMFPFPNHGHVFLMKPAPVLAYQIGTNETRVLVDVPHPIPSAGNGDMAHYLLTVTAPQLPQTVRAAFERAVKTETPRSMMNGKLHPNQNHARPGVFLLGDSFNMRHPLTGGGMTVGFSDVTILQQLLKPIDDLSDAQHVTNVLEEFYVQRKPLAATINILAGALYNVFTASGDPILPKMREGCMAYFQAGGICASGPVALLAGLNARPLVLAVHFFAVAVFSVMRLLLPFPTPRKLYDSYKLLSAAAQIVCPLLHRERVLSFIPFICKALFATKLEALTEA